MKLQNRIALITGASEGFGAEIARAFAREGADLIICARSLKRLNNIKHELLNINTKLKIITVKTDISKYDEVSELFKIINSSFGTINIIVNNAGIYGPIGATETVDWDEWITTFSVNLFGAVNVTRNAISLLKKNKYGKIINIGGGGVGNPMPNITAYAASKAALARFSESIAIECREHNIDVNIVAPGALNTQMMERLLIAGPEKVGFDFYNRMKKISADGGVPLTLGANLCVFLASKFSDGITGKIISAQWDRWEDWPDNIDLLASSDVYTLRRITGRERGMDWGDL